MKNKTLNIKHKLTEIAIEIAIIVFAISLSLFLERWREKTEDHHLEKKFLSGLRTDLQTDLKELQAASEKWRSMKQAARYFLKPEKEITASNDSTRFYGYKLFHNVYFFPNSNRYESLKSTGKLNVIKNETLQGNIIDLYQTKIPDLMQQIGFFNDFMNTRVRDYLISNFNRNAQNEVVLDKAFFTNIHTKNLLSFYGDLDDIMKRAAAASGTMDKVLEQIDQHPE
ncbi:hypothetical protein [Niabella ginsenosidivorans]|nr:hypothetical protein [Niabella ginsenosidivorans]